MLLSCPGRLLLFIRSIMLLAGFIYTSHAAGQVGIGTNTPDPKSILDIRSTTKGVLIPRLSTAQQATLSGTLTASQAGMMVMDASSGKLMGWTGTFFTDVTNIAAKAPLTVSATNQVAFNPGTAVGDLITWDGNNWVNMQPSAAIQHFSFAVDNRQPYLALNYCIAMVGIFPARNDSQPFVSQIQLFPFDFPPRGWAACNGQILAISQNQALFALLGTQFGGNGTSTFALPNLQGRIPVGFGQGQGLSDYQVGQNGGVESNTISH
ncbi:MAG TPA: tail fiber protein [Puia sp.]|nr:tail fiber protein [Puia sp.]